MPAPIVLANLAPLTKMGNESPKIATRADLRDGARGDSGGDVTPDPVGKPVISSFAGVFAQGNTLTLSGSFSAERNGQIAYITGDPAKAGTPEDQIVGFSGEQTGTGYVHNASRSFGKSGASLLADFAGNTSVGRVCIRLPERPDTIFISAEIYCDLSSWNSTADSPQIKLMRLLSQDGAHHGSPDVHIQVSATESRTNTALRLDGWGGDYAGKFPDPDYENTWSRLSGNKELDRKWNRFIMFARLPRPIEGSNGQRFARIVEHFADRQIPANLAYTDPSLTQPPYSWLAPETIPFTNKAGGHETLTRFDFLNAALPFYQLGIPQLKVWADCIFVNDTPERVELGNAPIMDNCTKLVVQKQLSRTTTEISIEVEEGNFGLEDSVYAFVVNDDTQYASGVLIREGV